MRWMSARLTGRVLALSALAFGAAACAEDDSRRIIAETCLRDGGDAALCDCLGRESVKRLDEDGLDAVVFGALGAENEADQVLSEMDEGARQRFRAGVDEAMRMCAPAASPN